MAPNNNQKNKRPNWFDNQLQNLGPEFPNRLKPEDIARDCRTIFRDLARGNVNVQTYYQYLLHPAIQNIMYSECMKKYNSYNIISTAMEYYIIGCNNPQSAIHPDQMQQILAENNMIGIKRTVYGEILRAISDAQRMRDASYYIPLAGIIGKYAYALD